MNRLPLARRAALLGMLVEGTSLRATSRLGDVSINTVTKLVVDLGSACAESHHKQVRNVRVRRLQCDEIWSFVGGKQKRARPERTTEESGDTWTWVGLDADTKLCVSYLVGGRNGGWAREFMRDCAARVKGRVQITTDGHRVYLDAVEDESGADVDYAQLQRIYGASDELDTRMGMQRFPRLTNEFSKKVENHAAMVAIHFTYYNFGRIHKTLTVTPAMAAGLTDHVWSLEEIVSLADLLVP